MPTKRRAQESINVSELPQQQSEGYVAVYSNHVEIGTSPWDFRFLFFEVTEDETGEPIREKKARVVMSPQHVRAFAQVLNNTIERWTKERAPDALSKPARRLDA